MKWKKLWDEKSNQSMLLQWLSSQCTTCTTTVNHSVLAKGKVIIMSWKRPWKLNIYTSGLFIFILTLVAFRVLLILTCLMIVLTIITWLHESYKTYTSGYSDSVTVATKGTKMTLVSIPRIFVSIDLSRNKFEEPWYNNESESDGANVIVLLL